MNDDNETALAIEKIGNAIMELATDNDLNYIDACIAYCDDHDIDYEDIAGIVMQHQRLQLLVQDDAQRLHFIPKENATKFEYEED